MSIIDNSRFQVIKLSEEEIIQGAQLSEVQKASIQNNITGYAHDYINVQYEDTKPHQAAIQQAYCRGAIEALEHLLHTDEEVRNVLAEKSQEYNSGQSPA